jgi:hypothetical protein
MRRHSRTCPCLERILRPKGYAAWLARITGQPWRLPSEAEWEKAARGTSGRIYPWGDTFDPSRANTSEGGSGATTPVGSYPSGASPCGAKDMSGNVYEWTSSHNVPYPYDPTDGREAPDTTGSKVARGGSWDDGATYALSPPWQLLSSGLDPQPLYRLPSGACGPQLARQPQQWVSGATLLLGRPVPMLHALCKST